MNPAAPLLSIEKLSLARGRASVLDEVSLVLGRGRTLGLLGESGAGKSTLALAIIGLLRAPQVTLRGEMRFAGQSLVGLDERRFQALRGRHIGLVFQDASASLDPCFTVGDQLCEPLRRHLGLDRRAARTRAVQMLDAVGIPDAAARLGAYPHQLSGGMQQRVMIAIALACDPELLIADEPTSALDVTIQAQIMALILERVRASGASAIFVLHDLALASQVCDEVAVLYAGQIVEHGPADAVLRRPLHPYTVALRSCVVELDSPQLHPVAGSLPDPAAAPPGCRFADRCSEAMPRCRAERPPAVLRDARQVACWLHVDDLQMQALAEEPGR